MSHTSGPVVFAGHPALMLRYYNAVLPRLPMVTKRQVEELPLLLDS